MYCCVHGGAHDACLYCAQGSVVRVCKRLFESSCIVSCVTLLVQRIEVMYLSRLQIRIHQERIVRNVVDKVVADGRLQS
jgi:hypothetical protein